MQEGEFIDMSELTVDHLSITSQDESSKPSRSKRRPVTSIVEWAQCFMQYIAIVGKVKQTESQTSWDISTLYWKHIWNILVKVGLLMIVGSARLQLLGLVWLGHREKATFGTWFLGILSANPTVSTALDPLTPPINAVELLRPQPRVGQDTHRGLENQGYVMSGIMHNVHSRAVSMSMLVLITMATPTETATTSLYIAQQTQLISQGPLPVL